MDNQIPTIVSVKNLTKQTITLHSEDNDSMVVPPGKHNIQSKFLWNLPDTVKETDSRPAVVSSNVAPVTSPTKYPTTPASSSTSTPSADSAPTIPAK